MKISLLKFLTPQKRKPVKVKWSRSNHHCGIRLFEPIKLKNKKEGDIFLKITETSNHVTYEPLKNTERFRIDIENKKGESLAKEIFSYNKINKSIDGNNLSVKDKYRIKKCRFGELLRLSSIMQMMENQSPHIRIFSVESSVYFHARYKFEPALSFIGDTQSVLKTIIEDKAKNYEDISAAAKKLAERIKQNKEPYELYLEQTNALVKCYIRRRLEDKSVKPLKSFGEGMDMILKRETVLRNKDFFNKLYERHGIDYRIKDPQ